MELAHTFRGSLVLLALPAILGCPTDLDPPSPPFRDMDRDR